MHDASLDVALKKISAFAGHERHYNNGQEVTHASKKSFLCVFACDTSSLRTRILAYMARQPTEQPSAEHASL